MHLKATDILGEGGRIEITPCARSSEGCSELGLLLK
jgi:hypothetical protein